MINPNTKVAREMCYVSLRFYTGLATHKPRNSLDPLSTRWNTLQDQLKQTAPWMERKVRKTELRRHRKWK